LQLPSDGSGTTESHSNLEFELEVEEVPGYINDELVHTMREVIRNIPRDAPLRADSDREGNGVEDEEAHNLNMACDNNNSDAIDEDWMPDDKNNSSDLDEDLFGELPEDLVGQHLPSLILDDLEQGPGRFSLYQWLNNKQYKYLTGINSLG